MIRIKLAGAAFLFLLIMQACRQKTVAAYNDTFAAGDATFAADESISPIIEDENYVFKALDPKANLRIIYREENQAVNMLLQDSVRVVILSRDLDSNEIKVLRTRNLKPITSRFAVDAITLIVNKASDDTAITINEIKKILNGETKTSKNIVFDNPGSSLIRYFKTLSGTETFKPKNIFALKSNKEVIKYVSTHPDALGFTGFAWLDDTTADYANSLKNIKIVAVKNEEDKKYGTQYFRPSQTTLSQGQYPLSRSLYIINCTGREGLGTGFASFLTSERGQDIILSSGLLPAHMPGREIKIKHTLN